MADATVANENSAGPRSPGAANDHQGALINDPVVRAIAMFLIRYALEVRRVPIRDVPEAIRHFNGEYLKGKRPQVPVSVLANMAGLSIRGVQNTLNGSTGSAPDASPTLKFYFRVADLLSDMTRGDEAKAVTVKELTRRYNEVVAPLQPEEPRTEKEVGDALTALLSIMDGVKLLQTKAKGTVYVADKVLDVTFATSHAERGAEKISAVLASLGDDLIKLPSEADKQALLRNTFRAKTTARARTVLTEMIDRGIEILEDEVPDDVPKNTRLVWTLCGDIPAAEHGTSSRKKQGPNGRESTVSRRNTKRKK